jgi:hypothetical protein
MKPVLKPPPVYVDTTELMILGDGRVLVHNLTPEFARLLERLNGQDHLMKRRASARARSARRASRTKN